MKKTNILIADDDIELCELLKVYLELEGMKVNLVHNGQNAINYCQNNSLDLLILDVMMPIKNGFDTLREIRRENNLPILMLTAKGDKIDRIVGLEMGADDYVAKPCDPRELTARIRAIVRRAVQINMTILTEKFLTIDDVSLNNNSRELKVKNISIELTSTEFDLLKLLMESLGQYVTRETISEKILGKRLQSFDRSIDMHISHLRKKLGLTANQQERIKTLRGNGYQFVSIQDAGARGSK
ncbi:MAG: two-component system response regulator CpxR [Polaribacter sp.]|jgi:two-component system response regulator CpxR